MMTRKRLWALLLSAALIVTQLPAVAMAENNAPEDGSIASFEPFPSGVAKQTVDVGTELSALNLPDTVTAEVYHVTEDTITGEDNTENKSGNPSTASPSNAGDSSNQDSGKTVTTVTTTMSEISVTWNSEPAYDGDMAGDYVFMADVGGYVLSNSAKLPQITVTVTADTVEKPTEAPPTEPLPCTKTEGCTLTDGHEGECATKQPPSNGPLVKTITGWTFVDDDFLTGNELSIPNVSMGHQADFDTVVSMLPTQIRADINGEAEPATLDITGWSCPGYKQDSEDNWPLTGEYTFTASLPKGYDCDPLPAVKVVLPKDGVNLYGLNNTITQGGLTVTASDDGEVEYTDGSGFTLKASGTYKISGTWNGTLDNPAWDNLKVVITVPDGVTADITLSGVTIDVNGTDYACAFAVAAGGAANITLTGTNALASGRYRAGLEVPENATVAIAGDGSLEAKSGSGSDGDGAGIGGSKDTGNSSGGTIIINGGTVEAKSNYGAGIGGGSNGGSGGIIKISGGTVTASSDRGAGIGGGEDGNYGGSGGTIAISGGTVTASSDRGAGIGGGSGMISGGGSGGTIAISGGAVTASSDRGAGIGGGYGGGDSGGGSGTWGGDGGQITIDGNAVVFAKSSQAAQIGGGRGGGDGTKTLTKGVVFEGSNGAVYGSPELPGDITIPNSSTLTVPDGSTLTIPDNTTLTNNGTIENYGRVNGDGTITNNGTINDHSNGITVSVTGNMVNKASEVMISFWKEGQELVDARALTGDTLTIQAEVAQKRPLFRSAAPNQVTFKTGNTELGTVSVTNGRADLTLTLTGDSWKPGSYTVTAEYGGGTGLLPNDTGTATLVVESPSYTITTSHTTLDFGSKTVNDAIVPDAQTVTITNTGNSPITGYNMSGNANFNVVYASSAIPAGGNVTFTVQPKTGLAANTYKETLTITTTEGSKATIDVSFTVETVKPTGGSGGSDGGSSYTNPNILHGTWTRTDVGVWMFRLTSGSYATSRWGLIDGLWYYFDHEGKMLTGWQLLNNRWYYLCTEATAKLEAGRKEGAMLTGWYFDPAYQSWFCLDASGAMATGWKEISGKWYYFYGNGAMAVNTEVDGYKLGPDGAWIK